MWVNQDPWRSSLLRDPVGVKGWGSVAWAGGRRHPGWAADRWPCMYCPSGFGGA